MCPHAYWRPYWPNCTDTKTPEWLREHAVGTPEILAVPPGPHEPPRDPNGICVIIRNMFMNIPRDPGGICFII